MLTVEHRMLTDQEAASPRSFFAPAQQGDAKSTDPDKGQLLREAATNSSGGGSGRLTYCPALSAPAAAAHAKFRHKLEDALRKPATLALDRDWRYMELHVTVKDRGIGIGERDLPRLFQHFVQIDSNSTRNHSGTGLL